MNYIEEFNNSYERILGTRELSAQQGDAFFSYFYDLFISKDERVARAFSHTDMNRQIRMLRKSLIYVVNMVASKDNGVSIEKFAQTHSRRELDINPELYDIWMDSLVDAAREFDPRFNEETELGWRLTLAPAITYMKHVYPK